MASTLESPGPDDPRYVVRFRLPAGDNNQERIVRMERRFPLACLAGAVASLSETDAAAVQNIDNFIHVFVDESGKHNAEKSAKFWATFGPLIFMPRCHHPHIHNQGIAWPENFTLTEVFDVFRLLGPFNPLKKLVEVLIAAPAAELNAFIATAQKSAAGEKISQNDEAATVVGCWLCWNYFRESSILAKGIALLIKAAEAGQLYAMCEYGYMLYHGNIGVQKDEKRGLEFLKTAAVGGNNEAMGEMGKREQSRTESVKWFECAAEAGNAYAAWVCYEIFQDGGYGQEQNKQKARHYLLLVAYGGGPDAMKKLAVELQAEGHTEAAAEWEKLAQLRRNFYRCIMKN